MSPYLFENKSQRVTEKIKLLQKKTSQIERNSSSGNVALIVMHIPCSIKHNIHIIMEFSFQ